MSQQRGNNSRGRMITPSLRVVPTLPGEPTAAGAYLAPSALCFQSSSAPPTPGTPVEWTLGTVAGNTIEVIWGPGSGNGCFTCPAYWSRNSGVLVGLSIALTLSGAIITFSDPVLPGDSIIYAQPGLSMIGQSFDYPISKTEVV